MIEQMSREEKIKFCGLNLEAEEDFDNTIEILIGNSGKEYIIAQEVIADFISLGRIHISNNYTKVIAFSKELEKYDVFNRALINRLDAVRTNSAISGLIINDYMAEKVKERKNSRSRENKDNIHINYKEEPERC